MNVVRRMGADVSAGVPLVALAILLALCQALLAGQAAARSFGPTVRFAICRGVADRSAPLSHPWPGADPETFCPCAVPCGSGPASTA